jgi:predicted phage tail protein
MSVAEIFRLLSAQIEGFRNYIVEAAENGIDFSIQHGEEFLGEEDLLLNLAREDLIITEIPAGSKGGGGKIAAAVAIMVAAFILFGPMGAGGAATTTTMASGTVVTGTTIGAKTAFLTATAVATNLALAGITQLIAPGPEVDSAESNQAALFSGPVNTVQQGQAVPIAYGELIVGGSPISVSFSSAPITPSFATFSPSATSNPNPITGAFSSNVYSGINTGTNSSPGIQFASRITL